MKKYFFVLVCLFLYSLCYAQDFQVYSSKGEVSVKKGDTVELVGPGMLLKPSSIITIPDGARLVILNEKEKKLLTLKNPTTDQLGNIIKSSEVSSQNLSESYLAFVKQKITDSGNPKDKNFKQTAGTSYRETDSLLVKVLIPNTPSDTTKKKSNKSDKN